MADEADIANDVIMADLERRIKAARGIPKKQSLSECKTCGGDIPEKRQQAIQGVYLCVECSAILEQEF